MKRLCAQARAAWVAFTIPSKRSLQAVGELYDVRDVARKSTDNAARLAALFQVFEQGFGKLVSLEAMERASPPVARHWGESR